MNPSSLVILLQVYCLVDGLLKLNPAWVRRMCAEMCAQDQSPMPGCFPLDDHEDITMYEFGLAVRTDFMKCDRSVVPAILRTLILKTFMGATTLAWHALTRIISFFQPRLISAMTSNQKLLILLSLAEQVRVFYRGGCDALAAHKKALERPMEQSCMTRTRHAAPTDLTSISQPLARPRIKATQAGQDPFPSRCRHKRGPRDPTEALRVGTTRQEVTGTRRVAQHNQEQHIKERRAREAAARVAQAVRALEHQVAQDPDAQAAQVVLAIAASM